MEETNLLPFDMMRSYKERLEGELGFVDRSRQLKQIRSIVPELNADKRPLTIVGPKGAGRRTVARAVHLSGSSWWRPFVEADFTGIDDENAYKFLFGHKEDHLFSSSELRPGLISMAANSTLCLKNFDRYSRSIQKEIANIYVDKQFRPVTSKDVVPVECRFVFTVGRLPDELMKAEVIDEPISVMLSEKIVTIPPLIKRREDIVPLAEKFIADCCREFGFPLKRLSKEAEKWLKKAPWNQNVNQLKKSVYGACINTSEGLLSPSHFALAHDGNIESYQEKQLEEISIQSLVEMKIESFLGRLGSFEATHLYEAIMDKVEEPLLRLILNYAKGNQIKASRMLGINRNTLRAKMTRYNIKVMRNGAIR